MNREQPIYGNPVDFSASKEDEMTENIYENPDDFAIKVGGKKFMVTRPILEKNSNYFREKLALIGPRKNFIELDGLPAEGVEWCVKYMTAGDYMVTFTPANSDEDGIETVKLIGSVLEAAAVMQLESLTKDCLSYLTKQMTVKTCIPTLELLRKFGSQKDVIVGEKKVCENMARIIELEQFRFIKGADLVSFLRLSKLDAKIHWHAIVTWTQFTVNEKESLADAISDFLKIKDRQLQGQIKQSWKSASQQGSDDVIDDFTKILCSKSCLFEENLSTETAFRILEIIKDYDDKDEGKKSLQGIILRHLAINFSDALSNRMFDHLTFEDISMLFTSQHLACDDEMTKWNAALQWVKVEQSREYYLFDVINFINFDKLSEQEVSKVMAENLIQKLPRCKSKIKRSVPAESAYSYAKDTKDDVYESPIKFDKSLVMFDQGTGKLTAIDLDVGNHTVVAQADIVPFSQIASVNGNIILYQNQHIYELTKDGNWKDLGMIGHGAKTWSRMVEYKNEIYLISRKTMTKYNPIDGTMKMRMPGCGLGDGFSVSSSSRGIFAFGGRGTSDEGKQFAYEWISMPKMPVLGRFFATATQISTKYVLGGRFMQINSSTVYSYDNKEWVKLEPMKSRRSKFGAAFYNSDLYVVGGTGKRKEQIEMYSPRLNEWKIVGEVNGVKGDVVLCVCDASKISSQ